MDQNSQEPVPERRTPLKPRLFAGLVHLCACATIAAVLVGVVFFVWYPGALSDASGVLPVFLLVLGVDVGLGPLCTVIVFNKAKRSLKFDLLVIVAIQLSALAYGVRSVYIARPAFVVYNVDRFDLVAANDIDPKSAARASADMQRVPVWGPAWIGAVLPLEPKRKEELLLAAAMGGYDIAQSPEFYVPLDSVRAQLKAHTLPLSKLLEFNSSSRAQALVKHYAEDSDVGFVPLRGKAQDLSVLIRRSTGDILGIERLQPWPS